VNEDTARILVLVCRQYLDGRCADPPEHLAHEIAALVTDETLSEQVRREARALLEEMAQ
jgi:hypothetical protein